MSAANAYISLARTLSEMERFDEALDKLHEFEKCIDRHGKNNCDKQVLIDYYDTLLSIHTELGEICEEQGQDEERTAHLNEALKACEQLKAISEKNNDTDSVIGLLLDIGALYRDLNNMKAAADNYQQAIELIKQTSSTFGNQATVYNEASHILFDLKEYKTALEYAKQGLTLLQSTPNDSATSTIISKHQQFIQKIEEKLS